MLTLLVALFSGKFKKGFSILNLTMDAFPRIYKVGNSGSLFEQFSCFFSIIPEILPGNEAFKFPQTVLFDREVKDTPLTALFSHNTLQYSVLIQLT